MLMYLLAHGVLGWYDELIFLGIVVIFTGLMFVSWFRSRDEDYASTDLMPDSSTSTDASDNSTQERFQLD